MAELSRVALDHVGILTTDGRAPLAKALGSPRITGRQMPSGVVVARFGPGDCLELVWPGRAGTPVDRHLARRGPGLHHLALRVDGPLAAATAEITALGMQLVGPSEPSSDGRPSVFLHPRSTGGVLVELVEGRPR
jgi:catechol 2,3-dioxygenase-like lactoylglutathione lyase family enzyme